MDILSQIVEMDKAAAARVDMAIEEERRLSDETGEGFAKMREEAIAAERAKVDAFCKEQSAKLEERLSKADKSLAEENEKLDEKFNSQKARWKAEIIGRITEG